MRSSCTLHPARFLAQSPSPPHQCALPAHFTLRAFSRNHLLLHTKRAYCALPPVRFLARSPHCVLAPPPARVRLLHSALLRTIAIQRLLAPSALRAQPWLSSPPRLARSLRATVAFEVFPPSSPFGEPAKLIRSVRLRNEATCGRQLQHCRN
jgi:hypothetical protein